MASRASSISCSAACPDRTASRSCSWRLVVGQIAEVIPGRAAAGPPHDQDDADHDRDQQRRRQHRVEHQHEVDLEPVTWPGGLALAEPNATAGLRERRRGPGPELAGRVDQDQHRYRDQPGDQARAQDRPQARRGLPDGRDLAPVPLGREQQDGEHRLQAHAYGRALAVAGAIGPVGVRDRRPDPGQHHGDQQRGQRHPDGQARGGRGAGRAGGRPGTRGRGRSRSPAPGGRAGPPGPPAGERPSAIALGPPTARGTKAPVCDPTARPGHQRSGRHQASCRVSRRWRIRHCCREPDRGDPASGIGHEESHEVGGVGRRS